MTRGAPRHEVYEKMGKKYGVVMEGSHRVSFPPGRPKGWGRPGLLIFTLDYTWSLLPLWPRTRGAPRHEVHEEMGKKYGVSFKIAQEETSFRGRVLGGGRWGRACPCCRPSTLCPTPSPFGTVLRKASARPWPES